MSAHEYRSTTNQMTLLLMYDFSLMGGCGRVDADFHDIGAATLQSQTHMGPGGSDPEE